MSDSENPFQAPAQEHKAASEFAEFHTAFLPSWGLISLSAVINVPLVVFSSPGLPPLSVGIATLVVSIVFSAIVNWLIIKRFTVQVAPTRLRCCNFYGIYEVTNWDNIDRVKSTRLFFGLNYLRVFSADLKRPIWLPLFLRHEANFFYTVRKYAGADSLLVNALQEAGLAGPVSS